MAEISDEKNWRKKTNQFLRTRNSDTDNRTNKGNGNGICCSTKSHFPFCFFLFFFFIFAILLFRLLQICTFEVLSVQTKHNRAIELIDNALARWKSRLDAAQRRFYIIMELCAYTRRFQQQRNTRKKTPAFLPRNWHVYHSTGFWIIEPKRH